MRVPIISWRPSDVLWLRWHALIVIFVVVVVDGSQVRSLDVRDLWESDIHIDLINVILGVRLERDLRVCDRSCFCDITVHFHSVRRLACFLAAMLLLKTS